jgi:hypothetical protein
VHPVVLGGSVPSTGKRACCHRVRSAPSLGAPGSYRATATVNSRVLLVPPPFVSATILSLAWGSSLPCTHSSSERYVGFVGGQAEAAAALCWWRFPGTRAPISSERTRRHKEPLERDRRSAGTRAPETTQRCWADTGSLMTKHGPPRQSRGKHSRSIRKPSWRESSRRLSSCSGHGLKTGRFALTLARWASQLGQD